MYSNENKLLFEDKGIQGTIFAQPPSYESATGAQGAVCAAIAIDQKHKQAKLGALPQDCHSSVAFNGPSTSTTKQKCICFEREVECVPEGLKNFHLKKEITQGLQQVCGRAQAWGLVLSSMPYWIWLQGGFASREHSESPEFPISYAVSKNRKQPTIISQHFQNTLVLIGWLLMDFIFICPCKWGSCRLSKEILGY